MTRLLAAFIAVFFVSACQTTEVDACPDPRHVQIDKFLAQNGPPEGARSMTGQLTHERTQVFLGAFNGSIEPPYIEAETIYITSAEGYPAALVVFVTGECATKAGFYPLEFISEWMNGRPVGVGTSA